MICIFPFRQKKCAKSNLVHSKYFSFYKFHSTKDFVAKRSFVSKQNDLKEFCPI